METPQSPSKDLGSWPPTPQDWRLWC